MHDDPLGLVDEFGGRPGCFDDGGGIFWGWLDREGDGLEVKEFGIGVEEGRGAVGDAGFGKGYVEVGVVAEDLEGCA